MGLTYLKIYCLNFGLFVFFKLWSFALMDFLTGNVLGTKHSKSQDFFLGHGVLVLLRLILYLWFKPMVTRCKLPLKQHRWPLGYSAAHRLFVWTSLCSFLFFHTPITKMKCFVNMDQSLSLFVYFRSFTIQYQLKYQFYRREKSCARDSNLGPQDVT